VRLTRLDAYYSAGILSTVFIVGAGAPSMVSPTTPDPLAIAMWLLGCVVVIALIVSFLRHRRENSLTNLRRLSLDAYEHIARLSEACDMLVPRETDPETMRLLVRMEEGNAVVLKETWRGVHHSYSISRTGVVRRQIFGMKLTRADRRWLNRPLTAARLQYLIQSLGYTYEQRVKV